MPSRPKRPCSYPGCPNLTDGQYCSEHTAIARKQYNKYERAADINKKYGRAWKRIRDRYVSEHPLCEQCLKDGRLVPTEEVHHKLPISQGGTHARENLMALCRSCHTKIHHDIKELTPEILRTFISKIVIHERSRKHAKDAEQNIDIYFTHIGNLDRYCFDRQIPQLK